MIVQLNDEGFVESYAVIGNLENGTELSEPSDIDHLKNTSPHTG